MQDQLKDGMAPRFPETFWWGTAASSPQSEGAAPASDWAQWELAGRVPPSGDGNGFAHRYAEDFALYAAHGLTHHRLGIEWSRIEPEEGRRDELAVSHYRRVLEAAQAAGISPWVCLHHFSLPTWLAADGLGFVHARARDYYWRRHVDFIAETFGDLVYGWQPVNEPVVYAANGFLGAVNPPGLTDWDLACAATEGAHLASFIAAEILRQTGRPVSTVQALQPLFPADGSAEAAAAADVLDDLVWRCWIRAIKEGVLELPGRSAIDVPGSDVAFDLVGFSYYNSFAVTADRGLAVYPPGARVGPMGYAPWSPGLGLVLDRLSNELPGRPLLIAEHGVGTTDDAWRCAVLQESLDLVAAHLHQGQDIRGFFHWTGVDNYEWAQGHEVQFGAFDVERRPKASAELLRATAAQVPA